MKNDGKSYEEFVAVLHQALLYSEDIGVLGILPPNTAKASEAPMFTGL